MDFSRCQPPCSRLIASDDQHGKCVRCVGLAHARDAIFGISSTVRDTSGFLRSELLQVADIVQAVRDAQRFPPASVFPALAFTASLGHASMHEDAVSSPLLRPDACPSLQGDAQSRDPLICFTPPPLAALRDLPGVSPPNSSYNPFQLHTPICSQT
ncbi:hypothetical protein G5714_007312 [Onychostoma macrolepis]|uniref:Uncharacterized protein n=1 Tax=Onychostoma macrolepis TaxID=369639 RepID=A0A7J6CZZ4_9TELE|nr:hypothetical protein G5714_007312 [Onychostoma macrolepis]